MVPLPKGEEAYDELGSPDSTGVEMASTAAAVSDSTPTVTVTVPDAVTVTVAGPHAFNSGASEGERVSSKLNGATALIDGSELLTGNGLTTTVERVIGAAAVPVPIPVGPTVVPLPNPYGLPVL